MSVAAIVLAAGSGERFGGHKQFELVNGDRLVDIAVRAVAGVAQDIVVVVPPDVDWDGPGVGVTGGASRAASVRRGLARVPGEVEVVVVHDAAHPLATTALVERLVAEVRAGADGAVPVMKTRETVAYVGADGALRDAVPPAGLVFVQMPHAFRATALRAAHTHTPDVVDDASLLQSLGHRIVGVAGEPANLHVTTPEELAVLRRMVGGAPELR